MYRILTMFGFGEDRRTDEERRRDQEMHDRRHAENQLSLGFLKTVVRPLLKGAGAEVGLVGKSTFCGAELLVEIDGVTYTLRALVDHDS
jgi:hypothetical protein